MIKINQILKYLKKNIYFICLIVVLIYIAYDKLYKNIENFEDLIGDFDRPGLNQHTIKYMSDDPLPDDIEIKKKMVLNTKLLEFFKHSKLIELLSNSEFLMEKFNEQVKWYKKTAAERNKLKFENTPFFLQYFYFIPFSDISYTLQNLSKNLRFVAHIKHIKNEEDFQENITGLIFTCIEEYSKVLLKRNILNANAVMGMEKKLNDEKEILEKKLNDEKRIKNDYKISLKNCEDKKTVCEDKKKIDATAFDQKISLCKNRSFFARLFNR
jgi:hypothetical protein